METGEYSVLTEYRKVQARESDRRISARSETFDETMTRIKQLAADRGVPEDDIQGLHGRPHQVLMALPITKRFTTHVTNTL